MRRPSSNNPNPYKPQALFQDGSDLPLFTGYNPQPESKCHPAELHAAYKEFLPADEVASLPVYRTTRVIEFYPNPPDKWLNLSGEAIPVVSGIFVSILRSAPRGDGWYLVEYEGHYAWTCFVAAV